jgi:hypothetical protein
MAEEVYEVILASGLYWWVGIRWEWLINCSRANGWSRKKGKGLLLSEILPFDTLNILICIAKQKSKFLVISETERF